MDRIFYLLFILAVSYSNTVVASKQNLDAGLVKYVSLLEKARFEIIEKPKLFSQSAKNRESAYQVIAQAIRIYKKQPSSNLFQELLRYSAEFSLVDPTKQVGVYLLPLWKTHPKQIIEITQSFPKEKRIHLRRQIKAALDKERSKN